LLHSLSRDERVTVLLTTHLFEEADAADHIAILDRGHLVAEGTPAELKRSLSGDVLVVEPREEEAATDLAAAITQRFGDAAGRVAAVSGLVRLERADAHAFVPALVEAFPGRFRSVTLGAPSRDARGPYGPALPGRKLRTLRGVRDDRGLRLPAASSCVFRQPDAYRRVARPSSRGARHRLPGVVHPGDGSTAFGYFFRERSSSWCSSRRSSRRSGHRDRREGFLQGVSVARVAVRARPRARGRDAPSRYPGGLLPPHPARSAAQPATFLPAVGISSWSSRSRAGLRHRVSLNRLRAFTR
jgi:hypothetical protein